MDILTLLQPADLPRARIAIGAGHTVHPVPNLDALAEVLRVRIADVVLLDPFAMGSADLENLAACLVRHVDVPIIGYVSVSPAGMRHAMALAAIGVRRVVLRGHDDQPSVLRALLDGIYADTLATRVLAGLDRGLRELPDALHRAVETLFQRPQTYRTARDLARAAGIPSRTCSRLLARAGLATARSLVSAARVVRAYHALRGRPTRVVDVAARLGYGTVDALVRDTRRTTGLRPTALADHVPPDALVARVVQRLKVRGPRRLKSDLYLPFSGARRSTEPSHSAYWR